MIFLQLSIYFLRSVMNLLVLSSSLKKFSNYANCMGCRGRHPLQKQTYWCGMSRTPSPTETNILVRDVEDAVPYRKNILVRDVEDAIPYRKNILVRDVEDAIPYRKNILVRDVEDAIPYRKNILVRDVEDAIPYRKNILVRDVEGAVPYRNKRIGAGRRGRRPLQKQTHRYGMSRMPSPTFCFARTPSPTEKTYWCGTSRTPSPTFCFARTPCHPLQFASQGRYPLQKRCQECKQYIAGRRGRHPIQFASQGRHPLRYVTS